MSLKRIVTGLAAAALLIGALPATAQQTLKVG